MIFYNCTLFFKVRTVLFTCMQKKDPLLYLIKRILLYYLPFENGEYESRTRDLLLARQALSQLS